MSTNGNGWTAKGDATRSRSAIRAGLLLSACLLFATAPEALAQTPQQRARIDYEAAKLALEQNRPDVALEKLEKVIKTLGPLPDLHALAAEAALQAK